MVNARTPRSGFVPCGTKSGTHTALHSRRQTATSYWSYTSTELTDCKSSCVDLAQIETAGLQLTERSSASEAAGCKGRLCQPICDVRWVNSDRQLADGLAKPEACGRLRTAQRQGYWKLVFDPWFVSAKVRREPTRSAMSKRMEQAQFGESQVWREGERTACVFSCSLT